MGEVQILHSAVTQIAAHIHNNNTCVASLRCLLEKVHIGIAAIAAIIGSYLLLSPELATVLADYRTTIELEDRYPYRFRPIVQIISRPEDYSDDFDNNTLEGDVDFEISILMHILDLENYGGYTARLSSTHAHADTIWKWLTGEGALDIDALSAYEGGLRAEGLYPKEMPSLHTFARSICTKLRENLLECCDISRVHSAIASATTHSGSSSWSDESSA